MVGGRINNIISCLGFQPKRILVDGSHLQTCTRRFKSFRHTPLSKRMLVQGMAHVIILGLSSSFWFFWRGDAVDYNKAN